METNPSLNRSTIIGQHFSVTPEKSTYNSQNIQKFPTIDDHIDQTEDCLKKNGKELPNLSHATMMSRRSPRLKDGVVKSLFNKNSVDGDSKNKHIQSLTFKQNQLEENQLNISTKATPAQHLKDSPTENEVLLDLDVNRPLVTQLTPRKKTLQSEKASESLKNGPIQSQISGSFNSSSSSGRIMSKMLSNALGLLPNSSSNANYSEISGSSHPDDTKMFSDDKLYTSKGENIKVDSLRRKNKSNDGTNPLPCTLSNSATSEDNENSKDCIRIIGTDVSECSNHIQNVNENERCQNTQNKTKMTREEKIAKKMKRKVQRKAKELEALVIKSSKTNEKSTEKVQWPNPEDVKRAYLELNLVPPSSPNYVS